MMKTSVCSNFPLEFFLFFFVILICLTREKKKKKKRKRERMTNMEYYYPQSRNCFSSSDSIFFSIVIKQLTSIAISTCSLLLIPFFSPIGHWDEIYKYLTTVVFFSFESNKSFFLTSDNAAKVRQKKNEE